MANIDGKEHFTLGCAHGVVGERKPLCGTVITCLITVHENEGKLMSPCTEHYRKCIRVRCCPARCSASSGITSVLVLIPCFCSDAADLAVIDEGFTSLKKQLLYDEHHCPLKGKGVGLPLFLLPLALQSPKKAVAELLF